MGDPTTRYSLKKHIKDVHEIANSLEFWHKCTICKKSFKSAQYLKKHLILHDDPNHFQVICDLCGKVLRDRKRLNEHVRKFHKRERRHPCNLCEKSFFDKQQLLKHKRAIHHVGKKFECEHCGRLLPDKYQLTIHVNNHLKIKKYHCKQCDQWYTAGHTLAVHIAINHLGCSREESNKPENIAAAKAHTSYEKVSDENAYVGDQTSLSK